MTILNKNYYKKVNNDGEIWIISIEEDGSRLHIPTTPGNRYYDEYLQWLSEGNATPPDYSE